MIRHTILHKTMTLLLILAVSLMNFEWVNRLRTVNLSDKVSSLVTNVMDRPSSFMNDTHYSCMIGNETVTVSTNNPAFVIVGTQKGGTSSLLKLLKQHPEISVGRGSRKIEVHYFDKLAEFQQEREEAVREKYNVSSQHEVYCEFTRDYASHFRSGSLAFDKTPSYMYMEQVPDLLFRTCPWKPKIIMVLRDPVDRAYSHFNFEQKNLYPKRFVNKSFELLLQQELQILKQYGLDTYSDEVSHDEWQRRFYAAQASLSGFTNLNECFRTRGMYWIQLLKWKELFSDVLVLNYDELYSDTSAMERVFDFIGVSPMKVSGVQTNKGSYDSDMSSETRQMLQEFFSPHNEKLSLILGEQWKGVWNYNTTSSTAR